MRLLNRAGKTLDEPFLIRMFGVWFLPPQNKKCPGKKNPPRLYLTEEGDTYEIEIFAIHQDTMQNSCQPQTNSNYVKKTAKLADSSWQPEAVCAASAFHEKRHPALPTEDSAPKKSYPRRFCPASPLFNSTRLSHQVKNRRQSGESQ